MQQQKVSSIDDYIALQPVQVREQLELFRYAIKKAAPKAEELISYGMPAFKYHGVLVYFAVYKKHYGFYPMPKTIEAFKSKLKSYKQSKGAVQFPIDRPLPLKLIGEMVKYRVKLNLEKVKLNKSETTRKKQ